jgi:hypothetical protein
MMSVIATLIDEHTQHAETERQVKAARFEARYRETLEAARSAFPDTLGAELWEELLALAGRPKAERDTEGAVTQLSYPVEHPELVPFTLSAVAQFTRGEWRTEPRRLDGYRIAAQQGLNSAVTVKSAEEMGAFLAGLVSVRAEREEDARRRRVHDLLQALNNPRTDPAAAEAARDELMALGEPAENTRRRFEEWQRSYEARQAREAEERENRRRLGDYALALHAWGKEWERARLALNERLRALQSQFDLPFNAFRLAYGVVAEEEGERFADTHSATVLEAEPDEDGWYTRLDGHELRAFRPAHPVSISRTICLPRVEGVRVRDEATGLALFAAPERVEEARAALAELVESLPETPDEPDPAAFGLEVRAHYETGGWHAWCTVENVREMVLEFDSLPPWREQS